MLPIPGKGSSDWEYAWIRSSRRSWAESSAPALLDWSGSERTHGRSRGSANSRKLGQTPAIHGSLCGDTSARSIRGRPARGSWCSTATAARSRGTRSNTIRSCLGPAGSSTIRCRSSRGQRVDRRGAERRGTRRSAISRPSASRISAKRPSSGTRRPDGPGTTPSSGRTRAPTAIIKALDSTPRD